MRDLIFAMLIFHSSIIEIADIMTKDIHYNKKTQARPRFYIICSISFADAILLVVADVSLISLSICDKINETFVSTIQTVGVASYMAYIVSSPFLSIECYIAVRFSQVTESLQNEKFCSLLIPMLLIQLTKVDLIAYSVLQ